MTTEDATRAGFSLRRWSARKRAAAREGSIEPVAGAPVAAPLPEIAPMDPASGAAPRAVIADVAAPPGIDADISHAAAGARDEPGRVTMAATAEVALPPIESLTPQSDFTPFMRPDVDPALKRAALRKLFADPQFNVMDGLDVYIDDYSKPDPIPPEILRTLVQARYIFDPPVTRVNARGFVEDVPPEEVAAMRAAAAAADVPSAASHPVDQVAAEEGAAATAVASASQGQDIKDDATEHAVHADDAGSAADASGPVAVAADEDADPDLPLPPDRATVPPERT